MVAGIQNAVLRFACIDIVNVANVLELCETKDSTGFWYHFCSLHIDIYFKNGVKLNTVLCFGKFLITLGDHLFQVKTKNCVLVNRITLLGQCNATSSQYPVLLLEIKMSTGVQ